LAGDKHELSDYEFHENWCRVSYILYGEWINSLLTLNLFLNLVKFSAVKCHMMFSVRFH